MAKSTIPFWGQAYTLTITYQTADGLQDTVISRNDWEPEALRITFEVVQSTIPEPWWFADIVIYNLNAKFINTTILNAVSVKLDAGFQVGSARSTNIWNGPIFQVLMDQENIVDTRITLHCIANPAGMADPTSASIGQYASQQQLLTRAAANVGLPPLENSAANNSLSSYAQDALSVKQYPRGNTVFGTYGQYLDLVANDQNFATYRTGTQPFMTEISDGKVVPAADLIYALPNPPNETATGLPPGTSQSIIDTPRQTPLGIIFNVLLDPRLKVQLPVLVVQIAGNPLIATLPLTNDRSSFITPLVSPSAPNLLFFVGQVRHVGDSRGNDWYTEVTGYSTQYAASLLDSVVAGAGS